MPVTNAFGEQEPRPLQELQRDKGRLFLLAHGQRKCGWTPLLLTYEAVYLLDL